MQILAKISLGIVVLVAFASGVRVGAHFGVLEFSLMDSSAKAALIAGELRALRAGSPDKLIAAKELELDGEVVKALEFQEKGNAWLFWPFASNHEHRRYLDGVARYRREYPAPTPSLNFDKTEPLNAEMAVYAREVQRRTQELTATYGE